MHSFSSAFRTACSVPPQLSRSPPRLLLNRGAGFHCAFAYHVRRSWARSPAHTWHFADCGGGQRTPTPYRARTSSSNSSPVSHVRIQLSILSRSRGSPACFNSDLRARAVASPNRSRLSSTIQLRISCSIRSRTSLRPSLRPLDVVLGEHPLYRLPCRFFSLLGDLVRPPRNRFIDQSDR